MSDRFLFRPIGHRIHSNVAYLRCWAIAFLAVVATLEDASLAVAQPPPVLNRRFPSEGYYSSLALIHDGRVREAQHGFETAYRAARQAADEHGIDSVPILIRTGQTLYLQGDIAEGLKQIDSGLLLAKRCRGWTRFIQAQSFPMRGLSNDIRGIQWYTSQRSAEPGAFPESWPVAMGTGTLIVEARPADATLVADVVRLDAIEVYLAQAMGLRLRYRWLGAIAPELSTSREILEAFPTLRAEYPEVLRRCHSICQAMAMIATGDSKEASKLIQSNLEVQGGWDHPLTGVGLLALADLAILDDDRSTAIRMLSESTLIFARLGQHDWMAEAVERLGAVAAVRRQNNTLNMLGDISTWLRTRSYLSHTSTSAAIALLAAEFENYPLSESNAALVLRASAKNVGPLPHLQAAARFARARALLKQGKSETGRAGLDLPLAMARGVDLPGPLSRSLYQWRWLREAIDTSQIAPVTALKLCDLLLDGPTSVQWLFEPWESLGAASADIADDGLKWLRLIERQGNHEATIEAMDRILRLRCRYHLPLAGRELDLRLLFHSAIWKVPEELKPQSASLRKQFPAIDQAANMIHRQVESARKVKSIDAKEWSVEEKNGWTQLASQCELQEQQLLEASTARTVIPRVFPPVANVAAIKKQLLSDQDSSRAILGFFVASQTVYGYVVTSDGVELWNVERSILANERFRQLSEAIGIGQSSSKVLASLKKPGWEKLAKELQALLFPPYILSRLASVDNLTIIPDDWLWYVPFEILPDPLANVPMPWIAKHSIFYAPTLGIAMNPSTKSSPTNRTLGVSKSGFFVPDKELDHVLTKELTQTIAETQLVEVPTKVHASRWSRLQFDQVWVALDMKLEYGVPFAIMGYDNGGSTSIRQWLQLPMVAPTSIVLAGCEVPSMMRSDADGIELFRLACCLAAMGNRATLINRWSPHGESSQLLLRSFVESSAAMPAAQAWRRSVLSLWETPLGYPTEPILGSVKKDYFQDEFTGMHPIFWSGTMVIGNTDKRP
jgi:CHAT domain